MRTETLGTKGQNTEDPCFLGGPDILALVAVPAAERKQGNEGKAFFGFTVSVLSPVGP